MRSHSLDSECTKIQSSSLPPILVPSWEQNLGVRSEGLHWVFFGTQHLVVVKRSFFSQTTFEEKKGAFWEPGFSSGLLVSFWVVLLKARGDFGFQFPKPIGYKLKIETLGYSEPEIIFLNLFSFFPPHLKSFFSNESQKLISGGTAGRTSQSIPVFLSLII